MDDLSDDIESLAIHRKNDKDNFKLLEIINPEKVKQEKLAAKLKEE